MPRMGETLNLALSLEGRAKPAPRNEQMVRIAAMLANLPDPEIDPRFMLALEAKLMAEPVAASVRHLSVVPAFPPTPADEVVRRAPVVQMPSRRFVVRRSVAAVAAAAALGAFPVAAAAQSLPGSPFYGLKRSFEKAQIALFGDAVDDGLRYMQQAQRRGDEAEKLGTLGAEPGLIEHTLAEMQELQRRGSELILANTSDIAVLNKLAEMAAAAEAQLRLAVPVLNAETRGALHDAIAVTTQIQNAVARALGIGGSVADIEVGSVNTSATFQQSSSLSLQPSGTTQARSTESDGDGDRSPAKGQREPGDDPKDPGDGKLIDDPEDVGCEIPGSEDGLGDLLAPVARMTCTQ